MKVEVESELGNTKTHVWCLRIYRLLMLISITPPSLSFSMRRPVKYIVFFLGLDSTYELVLNFGIVFLISKLNLKSINWCWIGQNYILIQQLLKYNSFIEGPVKIILNERVKKQVRLSRATLEFQVFQIPTGLKVFNSQVIYLISFTKIFRSKKSSIQDLSLPKKVEF